MPVIDPRPEASTAELVREAVDEARRLVKAEVQLARDEVRGELGEAKRAAMMSGVAAMSALLAGVMFLVALSLAIHVGPIPAVCIGGLFVITAAVFGYVAWRKVPRRPLEETRRRVETDARVLQEGVS